VVSTPGAATGFDVDRVVLSTAAPSASPDGATRAVDPTEPVVVESSARRRVLDVPPCPDGCWVILGEGYNDAWQATANGSDLGAPTLIDGNANGWWLEPTTDTTRVEITWPVQRSLNIAFALSALAALACLALVALDRRRDEDVVAAHVATSPVPPPQRALVAAGVATTVGAAVFIDWLWAIPVAVLWVGAVAARRTWAMRIIGLIGAAVIVGAGMIVTYIVRTESPFPDAGWPVRFEWLHGWTLFGVVLVVGSSLTSLWRERDG
jgi:arabinofuranan 3-O-arabinosyltransferase